jgi:hypothetical protein
MNLLTMNMKMNLNNMYIYIYMEMDMDMVMDMSMFNTDRPGRFQHFCFTSFSFVFTRICFVSYSFHFVRHIFTISLLLSASYHSCFVCKILLRFYANKAILTLQFTILLKFLFTFRFAVSHTLRSK